jgi:uncharacterized membrane protein YjjB (DUF3815 family)
MQARPADIPWIVTFVLLAWGVQEATKLAVGGRGSPFVAALVVAIAASLYGRLRHTPPGTVMFPAVMQLAPGFLGTQATLAMLRPGGKASPETFFDVLVVAVQLVLGLVVGVAATRAPTRGRPPGTGA